MNLIPTNDRGGIKPPRRSVVIGFIETACERFGVTFDKSPYELRMIYSHTDVDTLAEIAYTGMLAPGERMEEGDIKSLFVNKCKKIGLLDDPDVLSDIVVRQISLDHHKRMGE